MRSGPKSSSQQCGRIAFLVLTLIVLPRAGFAECLGCPTGALEVTVHLKSGAVEHGLIEIHASAVGTLVDSRPFPADEAPPSWRSGDVSLWQRSVTSYQVFEGASYLLRGLPGSHELLPSDGQADFTLPLLVINDALRIPLSQIAWIEDRSIPEGHWQLLGKPYPVNQGVARMVLGEAKTAISIRDRRETEDGMLYGLSFERSMEPDLLARTCLEETGIYELWSERGIVCISWGGTT